MNIYVLNDRKSGEYHTITLSQNDETIKRDMGSFSQMAHPSSALRRFPADFDVFAVGSFDVMSASIEADKRFVCNLCDCIVYEKDSSV